MYTDYFSTLGCCSRGSPRDLAGALTPAQPAQPVSVAAVAPAVPKDAGVMDVVKTGAADGGDVFNHSNKIWPLEISVSPSKIGFSH